MKNKNILLLLESHVDKIVLGVSVLVSLFLLWAYVISGPYSKKVAGRELGPSEIDIFIKGKAEEALAESDRRDTTPIPPEKNHVAEYTGLLQSSLSEMSSSVNLPSPGVGDVVVEEDRMYALPAIPSLTDVAAGNLRGAAKIPTEEIAPDHPYDSAASEIGDIDLVTVSAWFNVQTLYDNFKHSFMGPRLKTSWKDAHLAEPVFARLEVQRRTRRDDGRWDDWQTVPRTAIDMHRKQLMDLPLTLDASTFGVDIWMSQFNLPDVQYDILQPESYLFAVSRLDWMAPEFLTETLEIMKKQEEMAERERREELRREREASRSRGRRPTETQAPGMGRPGGEMPGRETTRRTPRTPPGTKERTADDVRADFEKTLLNEKSDFESMTDPLLVWAHDDTAQPGKTYQYRIRIGVFNPIAGKDWFQSNQAEYKNQLVLWSDYSEPTPEVSIPKRVYVFPKEIIADKETPEEIEGVQIEVAKYYLGQWRTFDFDVFPGEVIGHEVEYTPDRGGAEGGAIGGYESPMGETGAPKSMDKVDFTSGMTLVDVIREVLWGTRLRRNTLYKMLYYDVDNNLRQIAVGSKNWDSETNKIYDEIQNSITQGTEQRRPGMGPGMEPGMEPGMPSPGTPMEGDPGMMEY